MVDTAVKSLPFEDTKLYFGHDQPTAMFWRVVELEPIKVRLRFLRWEKLIEAGRIVRIEIIDRHPDALDIRVVVCNRLHTVDPFTRSPPFGHMKAAPAGQRFSRHVEHSFTVTFVVVICSRTAPGAAGSGSQTCFRSSYRTRRNK